MKKFYFILILFIGLGLSVGAQTKYPFNDGTQQAKYLKSYPNPATSNINFDFQKAYSSGYSILIYNFIGKLVFESKNIPSRVHVNLNDFYRGVYIYQLRNNAGLIVESGKFQVVK